MAEDRSRTEAPATPRHVDRDDSWTLAAELLTATFLWGGVGWLVDRWLGTGPVLMAIGFVLGNALGVYLLWIRSHDRFTQDHRDLMARRARSRRPAGTPPTASATDEHHDRLEPFPPFPGRRPPTDGPANPKGPAPIGPGDHADTTRGADDQTRGDAHA